MVLVMEVKKGTSATSRKAPMRSARRAAKVIAKTKAKAKAKPKAKAKTNAKAKARGRVVKYSMAERPVVKVIERPWSTKGVAKGHLAKLNVYRGCKQRTMGGLRKADLMKNRRGKIVSTATSLKSMKLLPKTIGKWTLACTNARRVLGIKGFVAVRKGTVLYDKARQLYAIQDPPEEGRSDEE